MRRSSIPFVLLAVGCLFAPSNRSTASPDAPATAVRIEPSKTWIGFVRVYLEMTNVTLRGDELEGRYRIRVPLVPAKNDTGTIKLRSAGSLDPGREAGGVLAGSARSDDEGQLRSVRCKLGPEGAIRIEITTDKRTLTFKTRYRRLG